jgi:oligopeptide/dipeptide ABC transporter ATP-binding protein
MAGELLSVRNLRISFRTPNGKVQAVRGLSLDLRRGETLAIVGESGSGKSVTARSLLGILAPNALVEGGEIIYNGTDLLKADEGYMQKIRGEKIAMIFQDPLSSLNPIVKIGKQLTEAMIIKSRERHRRARRSFNALLYLISSSADASYGDALTARQKAENKQLCSTFNELEKLRAKLEFTYETARENAEYAELKLADLIVKDQKKLLDKKSFNKAFREIVQLLSHAKNEYVIRDGDAVDKLLGVLTSAPTDALTAPLNELASLLRAGVETEAPDFLNAAFARLNGDSAHNAGTSVEEFLPAFGDVLRRAGEVEYKRSVAEMKRVIALLGDGSALQTELHAQQPRRSALQSLFGKAYKSIDKSKNRFDSYKDSRVYSFRLAINSAIEQYYDSLKYNQKLHRKHGDSSDLIDTDSLKDSILAICANLHELYSQNTADADSGAVTGGETTRSAEVIDMLRSDAGDFARVVTKQSAKFRAIKLMDEVGIAEPHKRFNQYPFEFSGGMRQRIVIAIALSANPEILICDEPTTALDVTIQGQILELINKLKERRNISVVFITHDLGVVANMADMVSVMYAGKIVEYGTAEDVFYNPLHPYTWALLSSMPDLDTTAELEAIPGTPPNMIRPLPGDAFAPRNRYALQIDFEEMPPLIDVSETHSAATWLLHPDAPKVTPPAIVTERIERSLSAAGLKDDVAGLTGYADGMKSYAAGLESYAAKLESEAAKSESEVAGLNDSTAVE